MTDKPYVPISPQQFFTAGGFIPPGQWGQPQLGFNSIPSDTPLLDSWRLQENMWCPGIHNVTDITRGLIVYLPLWERSSYGQTAWNHNYGYASGNTTLVNHLDWFCTTNGSAKQYNHDSAPPLSGNNPFVNSSGTSLTVDSFTFSIWAAWDTVATSPTATTYLFYSTNGNFYCSSSSGTITCNFDSHSVSGVDPGSRWYNIVYTRNGSVGTWYINGLNVGSTSVTGASVDLSSFVIGTYTETGGATGSFHGYIQRVGLWNRALSNSEVDFLFREPDCMQATPRAWFQGSGLSESGHVNDYWPTGSVQPPPWLPGFRRELSLARDCIQACPCWDFEDRTSGWWVRNYASGMYNYPDNLQPEQITVGQIGKAALVNYQDGEHYAGLGITFGSNVNLPTSHITPHLDECSWSFWYKLDPAITCLNYTRPIFWLRVKDITDDSDGADYYDIVVQDSNADGEHVAFKVSSFLDGGSGGETHTANYTWNYEHWYHIVVTRTIVPAGDKWTLYLNGQELAAFTLSGLNTIYPYFYVYGSDISANPGFGQLTCIHAWSRAITTSEITDLLADPWLLHREPPLMADTYTNFGPLSETAFQNTPFLDTRRLQEDIWCPGIINCHDIQRSLLFYMPLWERGGRGNAARNLNYGKELSIPVLSTAQEWVATINGVAKTYDQEVDTGGGWADAPFANSGLGSTVSVNDFSFSIWAIWDTMPGTTTYVCKLPSGTSFEISSIDGEIDLTFDSLIASGTDPGNRYYNIAFTRHGTVGTWYIDGAVAGTATVTSAAVDLTNFMIGDGTADSFHGSIQRIALWSRALTNSEVDDLWRDPDLMHRPPEIPLAFTVVPSVSISGGVLCGGRALVGGTVCPGGVVVDGSAVLDHSYTVVVPTGGVLAGGTVTNRIVATSSPSGGVLVGGTITPANLTSVFGDGTGINDAQYNVSVGGGVIVGGTARVDLNGVEGGGVLVGGVAPNTVNGVAGGGVLVGGTGKYSAKFVLRSTGGVLCGGAAVVPTGGTNASGGVLVGGSATISVRYSVTPSGGVIVGGHTHDYLNGAEFGGVLVGGTARVDLNGVSGIGGLLAGGNANPRVYYNFVPSNGVLVGGTDDNEMTYTVTPTDGVLCGGTASVQCIYAIAAPTGGVVVSGIGSEHHNMTADGGVLIGGISTIEHVRAGSAVSQSTISMVYSGGASNTNANASLGGNPSLYPIPDTINNLFDDVNSRETSFGMTDYRAFYIFNDNPDFTLYNAKIWIEVESVTDISIAIGGINDVAANIGIENNAPVSVSFSQPLSEADAITVGDMAPLDGVYVWVRRLVAANTPAADGDGFTLKLKGTDA